MQYIPYLCGIIMIIWGVKAILTQKLSGSPDVLDDFLGNFTNFFSNELNGFMAILMGIIMIAIGITLIVKADPIRKQPQSQTAVTAIA